MFDLATNTWSIRRINGIQIKVYGLKGLDGFMVEGLESGSKAVVHRKKKRA